MTTTTFLNSIKSYGGRSTLHGISQAYNSNALPRLIFWVSLTLIGTGFCVFHLQLTIRKFYDSPVSSSFVRGGAPTLFPNVTFCKSVPLSSTMLQYYKEDVLKYLENNWDYFNNWYPEKRVRTATEKRYEYKKRLQDLFEKYSEIMWVSDDVRDFGMTKDTTFFGYGYDWKHYDPTEVFHLITDYSHWNCYTFAPHNRTVTMAGNKGGLFLYVNMDSFVNKVDTVKYIRRKFREDEMKTPYTLKEYLTEGNRDMNDVVAGNEYLTDSMRIFLSDVGEYPTRSRINFDVSPSHLIKLEFHQTNIVEINRGTETRQCKEKPDYVDFVTTVNDHTGKVLRKRFILGEREAISLYKQEEINATCGCYSHQLPYTCDQNRLCYYVPTKYRINPTPEILKRLECHDDAYKSAEAKTTEFHEVARKQRTCKFTRYSATVTQTYWPESNQYEAFINKVFYPKYSNRAYFTDLWKRHNHRVFTLGQNMTNETVLNSDLLIRAMLDQKCFVNLTEGLQLDDAWCSNSEMIKKNIMKVWVKPFSTKADIYEEEPAYEWPEVLSEIGGTMGLWMGMSLLTVIEIIELFSLGWIEYRRSKKAGENEGEKSEDIVDAEDISIEVPKSNNAVTEPVNGDTSKSAQNCV